MEAEISKNQISKPRLPGLDFLKAIMAIMVVARHTGLIYFQPKIPGVGFLSWISFFYWNLQNLSVPTFLAISLWLYARNRVSDPAYFRKRAKRLIQVILFWWPVYFFVGLLVGYEGFLRTPLGVALMPLIDGGLYFLGTLLLQVSILELLFKLLDKTRESRKDFLIIIFVIIGFVVPCIARFYFFTTPEEIARLMGGPIVFMPYAASVLLVKRFGIKKGLPILLILGMIFTLIAYVGLLLQGASPGLRFFIKIEYIAPLSAFFAMGLIALSQLKKTRNSKAVSSISKYALGIYLVHPLVIAGLKPFDNVWYQFLYYAREFSSGGVIAIEAGYFTAIFCLTFIIVALLKKLKLGKFVS